MSWKVSKLKYFENIHNYNERISKTTDISFIKKDNKQKIKEYRIAMFGGSNMKGFGSALNTEELLRNKNFLHNNKFLVHNFADYGRTFSGHQFKILEKVINKYDIFFIYSGHNEFNMFHDTNTFKDKNIESLPNGFPIMPKRFIKPSEAELNRLIKDIRAEYTFKEKFLKLFVDNSRIYFFSKRVNSRLNFFKFKKEAKKNKNFALKKFSHKIDYFNNDTRMKIVNLYENNLMKIINNLDVDQKVIISTLAANDLFSPFGDSNLLDVDEIRYENAYKDLDNNLNYSKILTNNLPEGSNKQYILGMQCLERDGYTLNTESKKCYELLLNARRLDNIPARVFPEINDFIRSLKDNPQIIVIDLETEILKKVKNKDDYLSYFVDFQHLSPKGHLLLTSLFLHEIDKEIEIVDIDKIKIDRCGNIKKIEIGKNFERSLAVVPYDRCKWPLLAITRMLNSHSKYHKPKVFYNHYINQAKIEK